jgi:hypothetical protein
VSVRGTAGGNVTRKRYPFKVSAKTADMDTVKVLLQGAVSDRAKTPGTGRFMNVDIKDFCLAAPMERPEYIRVIASIVPPEILDAYTTCAAIWWMGISCSRLTGACIMVLHKLGIYLKSGCLHT